MKVTKEMREFVVILRNNGYEYIRCKGSHFIYSNGTNTIAVNTDLNCMTWSMSRKPEPGISEAISTSRAESQSMTART